MHTGSPAWLADQAHVRSPQFSGRSTTPGPRGWEPRRQEWPQASREHCCRKDAAGSFQLLVSEELSSSQPRQPGGVPLGLVSNGTDRFLHSLPRSPGPPDRRCKCRWTRISLGPQVFRGATIHSSPGAQHSKMKNSGRHPESCCAESCQQSAGAAELTTSLSCRWSVQRQKGSLRSWEDGEQP